MAGILLRSGGRGGEAAALNKKLAEFSRAGNLAAAETLFERLLPVADTVSWNTLLAARRRAGDSAGALRLFLRMRRADLRPTARTLSTVVAAASPFLLPQLHAAALLAAVPPAGPFLGTALLAGYAKAGNLLAARQLFDEMPNRCSTIWITLITAMMAAGHADEARQEFFDIPARTVAHWTALIHGHVRAGLFATALALFKTMLADNDAPAPNEFTFSAALAACASTADLRAGECVHTALTKSGVGTDGVLASSLVSMYARCGDVDGGLRAFELAGSASVESWNAVISCCARHGRGRRAVAELERMVATGVSPDEATMAAVLAACAREGLVEEGTKRLVGMVAEYGVKVEKEHYGCMVDMLARAGYIEEAAEAAMAADRVDETTVATLAWAAGECGEGLERVEELARRVGMGEHPAVIMALKKARGRGGDWATVASLRHRCPRLQKAASQISS